MRTFVTMLVAVMVMSVSLGSALAGPGEGREQSRNRAPAATVESKAPQAPPERHFPKAVQKEKPGQHRAPFRKPSGIVRYSPMLETFTIEEANLAFDVTKHVNTGLGNLTGNLSTKIDGVPFKLRPSLSFPVSLEADLKSKMVPPKGNVPYLVEITIDMGDIEASGTLDITVVNQPPVSRAVTVELNHLKAVVSLVPPHPGKNHFYQQGVPNVSMDADVDFDLSLPMKEALIANLAWNWPPFVALPFPFNVAAATAFVNDNEATLEKAIESQLAAFLEEQVKKNMPSAIKGDPDVVNAINALDSLFWLWAISLTDTVESVADANQVTIHSTLYNATPASAIYKISGS